MASNLCNIFQFLLYSLFLFISISTAQTSFSPKALVLPVTKDLSSSQYLTQISQRTPFVPVKLSIHLGGQTLWVDCEQGFTSSTYRSAICGSPQCTIAKPNTCYNCTSSPTPRPGCNKNACLNTPENPFINTLYDGGEIAEDVVSIQSTDGFNPGQFVKVPQFIFTCVPTFLTEGLASGVKGTAGLGRNDIALPSQFARVFGFARKFAICLSASTSSKGAVFFGDGPYIMLPNIDISKSLTYTPLFINPFGTGYVPYLNESSSEYFIGVKAININGKAVPVNRKLLAIDKRGNGGTKISTGRAYTVMETSIYNAVSKAFAEELSNVTRVASVAPFGTCFSSNSIGSTRAGPAVPPIDLVLQSNNVFWRIFGANSMVQVNKDVICLAFVDGGVRPTTSIVIGGYQIEENLLQFDIANSRLGFSSSLLFRQTTCANFNFTSRA
ncbi:probable aspartic proteinase GIP2 [Coffea arabica]|uniref:Probable aspartic proteinase GIP2 n=1 Tax=Coffea arabica TaxID=13443 RepID=A0A6P6WNJ1_COFAR|nr:basic 7S globulin-like [Coffea arabica]XP_027120191.1 basic 7S globulin-like [Coffea arabica]